MLSIENLLARLSWEECKQKCDSAGKPGGSKCRGSLVILAVLSPAFPKTWGKCWTINLSLHRRGMRQKNCAWLIVCQKVGCGWLTITVMISEPA